MREHRQAIRAWLGFRQASVDVHQAIQEWLLSELLLDEHRPKHVQQAVYRRVCDRLKGLQSIQLPEGLFEDLPLSYLRQYQRQVSVESPGRLLRRKSTAGRFNLDMTERIPLASWLNVRYCLTNVMR